MNTITTSANGVAYKIPADADHVAAISWPQVKKCLERDEASLFNRHFIIKRAARTCRETGARSVYTTIIEADDTVALMRVGPRGGNRIVWRYGRCW